MVNRFMIEIERFTKCVEYRKLIGDVLKVWSPKGENTWSSRVRILEAAKFPLNLQ